VDEISAMVGKEPDKCVSLPSYPTVGLLIEDHDGPTVTRVDPSGPAAESGIKKGDKILFINSQRVDSVTQGAEIIQSQSRVDRPLTIQTQSGTYRVMPTYPAHVTQCYWEIMAGDIRNTPATTNTGRSPAQAFDGHEVFKGVCRFFDGRASQCEYVYDKDSD